MAHRKSRLDVALPRRVSFFSKEVSMRTLRDSAILVCVLSLLLAPRALAQTTGEIRGTAVDTNGVGLAGVTVEASSSSLQGTRTAVTGAGGAFQIPALPPGSYRVVFTLSGFAKAERQAQVRLDAT